MNLSNSHFIKSTLYKFTNKNTYLVINTKTRLIKSQCFTTMIALLSQTCLMSNPLPEDIFKWALVTPFLTIIITMNFPLNLIIVVSLNKNRWLRTKVKTTHSASEKIFNSWKKIKSLSFFLIK
jgi:hypothetical protein